jgi:hypothetical protein
MFSQPGTATTQLTRIKAGPRSCVYRYAMSDVTPTDKVTCPACGRRMTLLYTIRRAFAENLNVFKCRCGLTLAKPESKTTPPRAAA